MGKTFKCGDCGKQYFQRKYFNEHVKNVHSKPTIPCGFGDCKFWFKVDKDRKQHIKRRHGEKKWKCNYPGCGYKTTVKQNLTRHGKVHRQFGNKDIEIEESSEFKMDVEVEHDSRSKTRSDSPTQAASTNDNTPRRGRKSNRSNNSIRPKKSKDQNDDDDEEFITDVIPPPNKTQPVRNAAKKKSMAVSTTEIEESYELTMDVKVEHGSRSRTRSDSPTQAAATSGTTPRGERKSNRSNNSKSPKKSKDQNDDDDEEFKTDVIPPPNKTRPVRNAAKKTIMAVLTTGEEDEKLNNTGLKTAKITSSSEEEGDDERNLIPSNGRASRGSRPEPTSSLSASLTRTSKYRKIMKNVYFGRTPRESWDVEEMCVCPNTKQKCTTNACRNRMVYTECIPECGLNCKNQRIQRSEGKEADLVLFNTPNKGLGVKTLIPIKKGEYIIEYLGQVVPSKLYKERLTNIYADEKHHYGLDLGDSMVIDAHRMGNLARHINHSCSPNTETEHWVVLGLPRRVLIAIRNIRSGEELSYDYNFSWFNPTKAQKCYCGSKVCRGILAGKTSSGK